MFFLETASVHTVSEHIAAKSTTQSRGRKAINLQARSLCFLNDIYGTFNSVLKWSQAAQHLPFPFQLQSLVVVAVTFAGESALGVSGTVAAEGVGSDDAAADVAAPTDTLCSKMEFNRFNILRASSNNPAAIMALSNTCANPDHAHDRTC